MRGSGGGSGHNRDTLVEVGGEECTESRCRAAISINIHLHNTMQTKEIKIISIRKCWTAPCCRRLGKSQQQQKSDRSQCTLALTFQFCLALHGIHWQDYEDAEHVTD